MATAPSRYTSLTTRKVVEYRDLITESWHKTVQGVLETAGHIVNAYEELNWDEWEQLKGDLPFGDSVCSMMMGIGNTKRFDKKNIQKKLPPNYNILYEYSKLDDGEWNKAVSEGIVDTDITTAAVRKWTTGIRFGGGQSTTTSAPPIPSIGNSFYAGVPSIDDLPDDEKDIVQTLVEDLQKEIHPFGLDIIYRQDGKTQRQQSLQDDRDNLIEKLEQELATALDKFNNKLVSRRELDRINDSYYQWRYNQHHNKYPYQKTHKESIQNKSHPYSVDKMDFPGFMKEIRDLQVITQWTPIREWGSLGKEKCIKLALDHSKSTTANQRSNFKRQLKNIVSRGDKNAPHAQKYLDMLVEETR